MIENGLLSEIFETRYFGTIRCSVPYILSFKDTLICIIKMLNFFFQLENCATPAIVTKDLAMLVYGRDGRLGKNF